MVVNNKLYINYATRIIIAFFLIFSGSFFACKRRDAGNSESWNIWSASQTLSVPLRIRKNQFDRGNLVINPSFEEGKYFLEESVDKVPQIKGWNRTGPAVKWADVNDSLFSQQEVSDGRHAVKIVRKRANETDNEGDGILSDYIKVIPGNFLLYYDLKLKNIDPPEARRGTRLFDAVNVSIRFFDRNKVPLSGKQYYPYKKIFLDSGFKGYSFSNFWHIDSLGWGRVRGRTYNYPLSEGDIPDGTAYVRLFFGLKGTGTMWVDNVDFRYSKWNFTALERMDCFFDSVCVRSSMLIPTPKIIVNKEDVPLFVTTENAYVSPLILVSAKPRPQSILAAGLIKEEIEKRSTLFPNGSKVSPVEILFGEIPQKDFKGLVISIGRTKVFNKWKDSLALSEIVDKKQAYIIESPDRNPALIILAGTTPVGDYYAATTLVQLFDKGENIYHGASIVDYPDFTGRSYLFSSWKNEAEMMADVNSIDRMIRLRFNKAYIGYGQTRGRKAWYNPDQLYIEGVKAVGNKCRNTGVLDMAVMINPYYHFDYEMNVDSIPDTLRYKFIHSNPENIKTLENVFNIGLDAGANTIMLMADDFLPHKGDNRKNYVLYTKEDKDKFVNLQSAQAYMINELHKDFNRNYPGLRFEFCPPWYLNEFIDRSRGKAEAYFLDLVQMIPNDVSVVWTGHTVRSLSYDLADFTRYEKWIGRKPMIWDNTLYARGLEGVYGGYPAYYPGKVRLCNLFEPYDVMVPENFQNFVDGPNMYMNGAASTEIYKIKYATVADFEWNTKDYDPEFSLWKVLVSSYGPVTARHLLEFSDAYYELISIVKSTKKEKNRFFNKDFDQTTRIRDIYKILQNELLTNPKLLKELGEFRTKALEAYAETEKQINVTK
jgi:hypothetical protein